MFPSFLRIAVLPPRQEKEFISRENEYLFRIDEGFVDDMRVPGYFYVNKDLETNIFQELEQYATHHAGAFLPAMKQLANVATLPGIVKGSFGMPDVHSGYGFAIGNVAACTFFRFFA